MQVLLLGTAAGGGFPQWNCWCRCCRIARRDPQAAHPRSQSSVAVSRDGRVWFLLNASPDIHHQLARLPLAEDAPGNRHVPIDGVLLTDAEVDHSLGVVLLREARQLALYSTSAVCEILDRESRFLPITRAFATVTWTELPLETSVPLRTKAGDDAGLTVEAFVVPGDAPRFAPKAADGHTVGLSIRDASSGTTVAFVPGCGGLDDRLLERLGRADVLLFDGTFWTDDELIVAGIGTRTARQMDHLPIAGADGSLARLSSLPCRHRIYTHINNTNPILLEASPERAVVTGAGFTVGDDGLHITI